MDRYGRYFVVAVTKTQNVKVEVEENEEAKTMIVGLGEENPGF
jgi:hypothetical protein